MNCRWLQPTVESSLKGLALAKKSFGLKPVTSSHELHPLVEANGNSQIPYVDLAKLSTGDGSFDASVRIGYSAQGVGDLKM